MVLCVGPTLNQEEIKLYQEKYGFSPRHDEMAEFFSLFSTPARLKIISLLRERQQVCVCDFRDILGMTASAISQHLAKLKAYKVVTSHKQGQTVFYSLTDHEFLRYIPLIEEEN